MDIASLLIPDTQTAKRVQPANRPFDWPTRFAQAAAMIGPVMRQHRLDPATAKFLFVTLGMIRSVALHAKRAMRRAATSALHFRNRIDQRQQLRHVMTLRSRQLHRQRRFLGVSHQMMFRAFFTAIRGVRAGFVVPRAVRTELESTSVLDQAKRLAWCSFVSNAWPPYIRCPMLPNIRFQQVMLLPGGRSFPMADVSMECPFAERR